MSWGLAPANRNEFSHAISNLAANKVSFWLPLGPILVACWLYLGLPWRGTWRTSADLDRHWRAFWSTLGLVVVNSSDKTGTSLFRVPVSKDLGGNSDDGVGGDGGDVGYLFFLLVQPKDGFGPSDWFNLRQGKGSFGGPKSSDARGD